MFRDDLSEEEATELGYRSITSGYTNTERWMLDNVLEDMARGGIFHAAIACEDGVQVWRKGVIDSRDFK